MRSEDEPLDIFLAENLFTIVLPLLNSPSPFFTQFVFKLGHDISVLETIREF
jgi:hypothetical protein